MSRLCLRPSRQRTVEPMATEGEYRCLVGNLHETVDNQMLQEAFEACGALSAKVQVDKRTGKSYGYGHVEFPDKETLEEAIMLMNGTKLEGCVLSVHENAIAKLPTTSKSPRRTWISDAAQGSGTGAGRSNPVTTFPRSTKTRRRAFSLGSKFYSQQESSPNLTPMDQLPKGTKKDQSIGSSKGKASGVVPKGQSEKRSWLSLLFFKPVTSAHKERAAPPVSPSTNRNRTAPQNQRQKGGAGRSEPRRHTMPLTGNRYSGD